MKYFDWWVSTVYEHQANKHSNILTNFSQYSPEPPAPPTSPLSNEEVTQAASRLYFSGAWHNFTGTSFALLEDTHQDKFKKCSLVYFQKLLIPHRDVICSLFFVLIILRRRWIILVMGAPLNHLIGFDIKVLSMILPWNPNYNLTSFWNKLEQ